MCIIMRHRNGADPPPRAPMNGRPGFPFGFLGAGGGRLPKAKGTAWAGLLCYSSSSPSQWGVLFNAAAPLPSSAFRRLLLVAAWHAHVAPRTACAGCVRSQVSNFASTRNAVLVSFPQHALDLRVTHKDTPTAGGGALRDRNPPRKAQMPEGAPEPAKNENANDGKAPHVTKTEPTSTRAAHPVRKPPETAPDERGTSSSVKALINAVADIPTVSSLHRWRPAQHHGHDPRAELRGAQALCPHRPRSVRVATPWWLYHLEQRGG